MKANGERNISTCSCNLETMMSTFNRKHLCNNIWESYPRNVNSASFYQLVAPCLQGTCFSSSHIYLLDTIWAIHVYTRLPFLLTDLRVRNNQLKISKLIYAHDTEMTRENEKVQNIIYTRLSMITLFIKISLFVDRLFIYICVCVQYSIL